MTSIRQSRYEISQEHGRADYLLKQHLPELDIYFSFTGGPMLQRLEEEFGTPFAVPLYCSVDPEKHRELPAESAFACDMSYMGTYAAGPPAENRRTALCSGSQACRTRNLSWLARSILSHIEWPENVERIMHLNPRHHAGLYSSSRITLNVTRREMVLAGYSPSVRLFEAAACGAAIASDNWPGLETFLLCPARNPSGHRE